MIDRRGIKYIHCFNRNFAFGGATLAYELDADFIYVTTAFCATEDRYVKSIGRDICRDRFGRDKEIFVIPKSEIFDIVADHLPFIPSADIAWRVTDLREVVIRALVVHYIAGVYPTFAKLFQQHNWTY